MHTDQIQRLIDINPDPCIIVERSSGSILYANNASGINGNESDGSRDEAPGYNSLYDIIIPSEKGKLSELLQHPGIGGDFRFRFNSGTSILNRLRTEEFDDDKILIVWKDTEVLSAQSYQPQLVHNSNDSSSKLETIVNNLPMVLLELDSEGKFVLQEGKALLEAGLEPGQLVGMSFYDTLGSTEVTQPNGEVIDAAEAFRRVMSGKVVVGRTNFADRFFDNYFVPVKRDGKKPDGLLGICLDITERVNFEKSYRSTEERFRLIAENTSELISMVSEGRYLYISPSYEKLFGYTLSEIKNLGPHSLVHPDDLHLLKDWQTKGMLEFRVHNKKGEYLWIEGESFVITGEPEITVGIARDVSKRRAAEDALKESEERYRRIVENANEGILLIDSKQVVTFVNSKLADIVGYKPDELIGRPVTEFVFDEDRFRAESYIRDNIEGSKAKFKFRLKHRDRAERWVTVNAVPVFDDKDIYTGGLALITDITEQRTAEAAYHRLNELLRSLINYSPLGVITLDKDGKTELWNPAAERMFGWSSEEVKGKPVPFVPADKIEEHLALRSKIMNGGSFTDREVVRLKKDGKKIQISISAAPLFDSYHQPMGISSFLIDVSEKKKSEQEREKLFKQITAARNRLKILSSKLISIQETEKRNISRELHDEIGQLLTAIKIDAQRIKQDPGSPEINSIIDDCTRLVENTISVVRNLSIELRPAILDDLGLAASLRWYVDKFQQRTGIQVKTEINRISDVLPPDCSITLFRICQEALTNIAKHAEAGYVKVSLYQNKSSVVLTVEDDGIGFDVIKAMKKAVKGKSLGLITMQERAELLGGKFTIKSIKGSGTIIMASCRV